MKYFSMFCLILPVAGILAAQNKVVKEVPVRIVASMEGKDLFREYCAVCHGVNGMGHGPAADALKRPVSDLTQISKKNGGKFPTLAVKTKIQGGEVMEHGTVEMPIWGKVLTQPGENKNASELRVYNLLKFVEELQTK